MMVPKFRAYIKNLDEFKYNGIPHKGHFIYGNLIKGKSNYDVDAIVGDLIEINDEYVNTEWWKTIKKGSAEQFTGLKDVNGKPIYEGDIVQFPVLGKPHRAIVAWSDMDSAFIIGMMYLSRFQPKMEVLGNIHTNPELLEADNV